jgi:serine-type D-Ala-D-Ala carboxypeptidase/endopeptidase
MAIIVGCALFQWGRPPRTVSAPPLVRIAIKLDTRNFDACAGEYEFAPSNLYWAPFKITLGRQGDHLVGRVWVKTARQRALDLYPASETNFFLKDTGGQFIFVKNEKGEVTGVIYRLAGFPDIEGKRLKN